MKKICAYSGCGQTFEQKDTRSVAFADRKYCCNTCMYAGRKEETKARLASEIKICANASCAREFSHLEKRFHDWKTIRYCSVPCEAESRTIEEFGVHVNVGELAAAIRCSKNSLTTARSLAKRKRTA